MSVSDELVFLGTLAQIRNRYDCPLCGLIVRCIPRREDTTDEASIHCILNPRPTCGETYALYLGQTTSAVLKAWIRIEFPPETVDPICNNPSPEQNLDSWSLDEMVERSFTIDGQKIRSWLQECEKHHGTTCDGHELGLNNIPAVDLLLIDVVEEKLVNAKRSARYIALSYVWGGWGGSKVTLGSWALSDFLRTKGAFRSPSLQLPNALRDAMDLTRSLGERYLWCDAICVFQESQHQKEEQILQMDLIYSQALLTIVALNGKHGDQPLPGVRPGSRQPAILVSEPCGGIRFIARMPSVEVLAAGSVYESRAWTFQEKLLSKRCLYVADNQVFFHCAMKSFREDEDIDYPNQKTHRSSLYSQSSGLAAMLKGSNMFGLYSKLVNEYTNRNLTKSQDILNAFEGIRKVLERHFGEPFIKGLPVHHFTAALLWTPHSSNQDASQVKHTSKDFAPLMPSWSWAGHAGRVCYGWSGSRDLVGDNEASYKCVPVVVEFAFIELSDRYLSFQRSRPWYTWQGIESPNYSVKYVHDGREIQSPGCGRFLIHYVHFGISFLRRLEVHLLKAVFPKHHHTSDGVRGLEWHQNESEILTFLNSYRRLILSFPFSHMPTLQEFERALRLYRICHNSNSNLDFWPFNCVNENQQVRDTAMGPAESGESQEYPDDSDMKWPFACVPSPSTLRNRLLAGPIVISAVHEGLSFWATVHNFAPERLQGGQLFRNSFSASSYSTTIDGTIQCNVAMLRFTIDSGVSPGQESQTATVFRNAASQPCGIILENEDMCVARINGRRCYLIFLSTCLLEKEVVWDNYIIVAETTETAVWERIAIARVLPSSLEMLDDRGTYRYVQLK